MFVFQMRMEEGKKAPQELEQDSKSIMDKYNIKTFEFKGYASFFGMLGPSKEERGEFKNAVLHRFEKVYNSPAYGKKYAEELAKDPENEKEIKKRLIASALIAAVAEVSEYENYAKKFGWTLIGVKDDWTGRIIKTSGKGSPESIEYKSAQKLEVSIA